MFINLRSRQEGDTIVEVMIAVAIVSLILSSAYLITMKNTQNLQNSAERVQAQHLVSGQIEALKAANGISAPNTCFAGSNPASGGACTQATEGSGASYKLAITQTGSAPIIYTVSAVWTSLGGNADDSNVTMYYRL